MAFDCIGLFCRSFSCRHCLLICLRIAITKTDRRNLGNANLIDKEVIWHFCRTVLNWTSKRAIMFLQSKVMSNRCRLFILSAPNMWAPLSSFHEGALYTCLVWMSEWMSEWMNERIKDENARHKISALYVIYLFSNYPLCSLFTCIQLLIHFKIWCFTTFL